MIYCVGINDTGYNVVTKVIVDGKEHNKMCPYYSRWAGMLGRCYSSRFHKKHPTYTDVTVCKEWLVFSNFRKWMEKQDWEGKCLDKDLLVYGNKIYSPETCIFISDEVNTLLLKSDGTRGELPLGVRYKNKSKGMLNERTKPYSAQITNRRLGKKYVHLGYFSTPDEAHKCWQLGKCDLILTVAEYYDKSSIEYKVLLKAWDRIYDDYISNRQTV